MVVFWIKAEKKAESADHPKNEHGKSKLVCVSHEGHLP